MAIPRLGGPGIPLSVSSGLVPFPSTLPTVASGLTNAITLAAAEIFNIPAGTYFCAPGPYTSLQWLDPVMNQYRTISAANSLAARMIDSDGGNFRLANLTGTPVSALITNKGAAATYTNGIGQTATACTVTPSSGNSVWVPVVGGAINSSITITAGGTSYSNNFPPILIIDAPPAGGIQATAICTTSAGAINAVTVTNQGAGYTTAPAVTIVNDPRDTTGSGGVLTVNATLVASGQLTALYPSNPGTALTSVPTFTFSPASTTAATAVMNFVVTGFTVVASGAGYKTSQPFLIISQGGIVGGTEAANVAGPISDTGMTFPRLAQIAGTSKAGGNITTTGSVVTDAGFGFQAVPKGIVLAGGTGIATTAGTVTLTVGGITDTSYLQRI